jgi:hypothetical protein
MSTVSIQQAETRVIKVAVLISAEVRPKDLSGALDVIFEDWDEVLQFTVEGNGWDGKRDVNDELLEFALGETSPA